jgi:hypothetical protein
MAEAYGSHGDLNDGRLSVDAERVMQQGFGDNHPSDGQVDAEGVPVAPTDAAFAGEPTAGEAAIAVDVDQIAREGLGFYE